MTDTAGADEPVAEQSLEVVRVLIPDHPDLAGVLGRAVDFADALRYANDIEEGEDSADPWQLPEQLVAPELQAALEASVLHNWRNDVGSDSADKQTQIGVSHAGVEHMGVYIATATRAQLSLLRAALDILIQAETTSPAQRLPTLREVAEFVGVWRDTDEDESLAAWQTTVRVLTLAISTAPAPDRPARLYDTKGVLLPTEPTDGSTPETDIVTVLNRIGAGDGRSVDLDGPAWHAWQRLTAEWHAAVYGSNSNDPSVVLNSFAY